MTEPVTFTTVGELPPSRRASRASMWNDLIDNAPIGQWVKVDQPRHPATAAHIRRLAANRGATIKVATRNANGKTADLYVLVTERA